MLPNMSSYSVLERIEIGRVEQEIDHLGFRPPGAI